ncbi:MAG TPA: hypothetical protein VLJ68_00215 [Chitinophagaceae bacterium]|nr:hypothetical protein [Chitinophagaceae bacterium]
MFIQKRVYKYLDNKIAIRRKIELMPTASNLTGKWIDDENFVVRKKGPLSVFRLRGDISQVADHWRLNVFITANPWYCLFFFLPLLVVIGGLALGRLMPAMAGVSLFIFVVLFNSANIYSLKRKFKEGLHIL